MKQGLPWRIALTLCILLASVVYLLPTFLPVSGRDKEPGLLQRLLPNARVSLGLDLMGGIQLNLGVEAEKAVATSIAQAGTSVMDEANSKGMLMTRPRIGVNDHLEFMLASPAKKAEFDEMLAKRYDNFKVVSAQDMPDGKIRYTLEITESARAKLVDNTIEQALKTIRNRIDQFGVAEPDVRRQQGGDRISIQLPGMDDSKRAVDIIAKTAHLEFRLVREDVDPKSRVAPVGVAILPMDIRLPNGDKVTEPIAVDAQAALTGDHITDARPEDNHDSSFRVSFSLDREGANIFSRLTRENLQRRLAIVLDGRVYSAPTIQSEISNQGSITGRFTANEAADLALVLRAGSLPAPVVVLEQRSVGPSLGQESINMGVTAALVGGCAVMIFMLVYYGRSGLIADIMLFLDVVLILAGLAAFGGTLTLPGIAGIVLTLGMAVDANVLIFERIREEMHKGLTPVAAIEAGFSRAMLAITDSNLTTVIAALILYQFGTGPIRGFAVTLTLGILASMFTAIFVSRIVFDIWMGKPGRKLSI